MAQCAFKQDFKRQRQAACCAKSERFRALQTEVFDPVFSSTKSLKERLQGQRRTHWPTNFLASVSACGENLSDHIHALIVYVPKAARNPCAGGKSVRRSRRASRGNARLYLRRRTSMRSRQTPCSPNTFLCIRGTTLTPRALCLCGIKRARIDPSTRMRRCSPIDRRHCPNPDRRRTSVAEICSLSENWDQHHPSAYPESPLGRSPRGSRPADSRTASSLCQATHVRITLKADMRRTSRRAAPRAPIIWKAF